MNAIVPLETLVPAFALPREELIHTLQNSVYPGAAKTSIELVLSYCQAQLLDPLQKPVHIVPMWDRNLGAMRDVIMPGIGLYRVQAARTGQHAGTDEPVFGPIVEDTIDGMPIKYPEWCRVTVHRILNGAAYPFTAVEYWRENYATRGKVDGRKSDAPNAMWAKRPRGQIAKCAEAQALRKSFPELGAAPTAEEMEGKPLDPEETVINEPPPRQPVRAKSETKDVDPETGEIEQPEKAAPPPSTPVIEHKAAPPGLLRIIRAKAGAKGVSEADLLVAHELETLEGISVALGNHILETLK